MVLLLWTRPGQCHSPASRLGHPRGVAWWSAEACPDLDRHHLGCDQLRSAVVVRFKCSVPTLRRTEHRDFRNLHAGGRTAAVLPLRTRPGQRHGPASRRGLPGGAAWRSAGACPDLDRHHVRCCQLRGVITVRFKCSAPTLRRPEHRDFHDLHAGGRTAAVLLLRTRPGTRQVPVSRRGLLGGAACWSAKAFPDLNCHHVWCGHLRGAVAVCFKCPSAGYEPGLGPFSENGSSHDEFRGCWGTFTAGGQIPQC